LQVPSKLGVCEEEKDRESSEGTRLVKQKRDKKNNRPRRKVIVISVPSNM